MSTENDRPGRTGLASMPPPGEVLIVGVGSNFSTAMRAVGGQTLALRMVRHGAVSLAASHAAAASASGAAVVQLLRAAAAQVAQRARLDLLRGSECPVLGSAGISRAVIKLGAGGRSRATLDQVRSATETLAETWVAELRANRPQAGIETMMIGAAVLEAVLDGIGAREIVVDDETPRESASEID
jgi:hypothetical protein